ncbi:hypothetical protein ACPW7J_14010 [Ihubacter sp. rT4E-8]|uniref:hypothetical protein n=1 Tax=Ihubacter sp. rT4E-8 TaxID=3242369 RepID=UPI003CEB001C
MKNLEQIEKQMDKRLTQLKNLSNQGLEYLKQTENRMQKYANVSCCFEMYVNDKVSNVITKIEERVIKLTQTPYQIKIIANTGEAIDTIQGLEERLNRLMTKWSLGIQLQLPTVKGGGRMLPGYQQPQSLEQRFQKEPLGTTYEGLRSFANTVNIFSAFKNLKEFKPVKAYGEAATGQLPNLVEKSTQLMGKSKLLTKGMERMATTRIGQAASTAISNIPAAAEAGTLSAGLGLATTGGAMLTAYGLVDGATTLYDGITSENDYDRIHDIVNGGFSFGGTTAGAIIGSMILPGVGTALGGGLGYLFGKIGGIFADDKIADKHAFDEKSASKYADDGRSPLESEMVGNIIAAPATLVSEFKAVADQVQSSFNTGTGTEPIYGGAYVPDYSVLNAPMDVEVFGQKSIRNQIQVTAEDFGIPKSLWVKVDAQIYGNKSFSDSRKGWANHPREAYRGGIIAPAFADGGYVHGGAQLITVAEEGTPEAIIPLGRHRRKRAMELFNQVGSYLQAPGFSPKGFAAGGIVGGSIGGLSGGGSSMPIAVEVGGVEIKIEAKDGQSLVETIRENKEAISEEIAGVFNAAFRGQFANTPATGGAGL